MRQYLTEGIEDDSNAKFAFECDPHTATRWMPDLLDKKRQALGWGPVMYEPVERAEPASKETAAMPAG